jgi:hypothetical protein
MRPICRLVLVILCSLIAAPCAAAAAQQAVPLAGVARAAHLQYAWLGPTRAVQLSGPGLVLVIRPGDNVYEINDRVEATAVTPRYASNDIYVSQKLANHIEQVASQAWLAFTNAQEAQQRAIQQAQAQTETAMPLLQGVIVLNVQPLKGAEALLITGSAPPSAPVLITLLATLSSDIPNVLVSRHDLTAGPDGKFQAIIPIGPDYVRNSYLHVLATSAPGVTSASAQILVDAPNAGVKVPYEQQPGGIW